MDVGRAKVSDGDGGAAEAHALGVHGLVYIGYILLYSRFIWDWRPRVRQ
ncbi:hypothetical protein FB468_0986 [Leucobacter komagatae]|uniref:Uncharacterized protein n=1 Tax=Leucobacter komagatae TaxID=55969 RepID=A0A542Y4G9_9MICO|nr:hypothetical protein FB468_0986 [Leucobacter komagatae]